MRFSKWLSLAALVFPIATGGCGSHAGKPRSDAATDVPADSATPSDGATVDAPASEVSPEVSPDVAPEASPEVAPEVSPDANDASRDVATDVSVADGGLDVPSDVSLIDAGPSCADAGADAGVDGGAACALPLFNTGVDSTGAALAGGSVDPHYKLITSAEPTLPGPDAIVTSQIADGFWVPQSADAKWIAPSANQSYPGATPCNTAGTYVYRTTFDLTGYDPATVKISGAWGADNSGTAVRLNGVSLGITAGSYNPLTAFKIEAGFIVGKNTLDFEILDSGCPNGLRVEMAGVAALAH